METSDIEFLITERGIKPDYEGIKNLLPDILASKIKEGETLAEFANREDVAKYLNSSKAEQAAQEATQAPPPSKASTMVRSPKPTEAALEALTPFQREQYAAKQRRIQEER